MAAFDDHRTPQLDIVEDCVHCGFCLDTCPTYALWADEADSPRGRIVLIGDALTSAEEVSDEMVTRWDRCLGCMACVTACPSGVRYDRLIERVRPQVERHHRRSLPERALRRLIFSTLPHPGRLRAVAPMLGPARRLSDGLLPGRLAALTKVAPRAPLRKLMRSRLPERTPAVGPRRGRVGLLLGCVQRVFYAEVQLAAIRALAAEGFEVLAPRAPACCGALEFHAGEEGAAVKRAEDTIAAFAALGELDYVVITAAGCGSAMKEYGDLLDTPAAHAFARRVRDVTEILGDLEPVAPRGPVPLRVAYHDACHLAHAQAVRSQPRQMLQGIPELELLEVGAERDLCCGSAGIYNLIQPEPAAELGARKASHLVETGAQAIAAANPGCAAQLDLHLRELGHPLPIYHPVELVWQSIKAGS
ncbi:MAG TPA: heterodisulfide reductase-related iron-sulfur binding cluster [Solirubrobacteraceae bacterium]|nr:heterodisulfide reductase-related iron-sulfur binding cluster [Solirubrobacteraceae bacterium]